MSDAPPGPGLPGGFKKGPYLPDLSYKGEEEKYHELPRPPSPLPNNSNEIDIAGIRQLIIDHGCIIKSGSKAEEFHIGIERVHEAYIAYLIRKRQFDEARDRRGVKVPLDIKIIAEGKAENTVHKALVRLLEDSGNAWKSVLKKQVSADEAEEEARVKESKGKDKLGNPSVQIPSLNQGGGKKKGDGGGGGRYGQ